MLLFNTLSKKHIRTTINQKFFSGGVHYEDCKIKFLLPWTPQTSLIVDKAINHNRAKLLLKEHSYCFLCNFLPFIFKRGMKTTKIFHKGAGKVKLRYSEKATKI